MTIRVLAIGDTADNMYTLKKFVNDTKIDLINFPKKQVTKFTENEKDVEFFDSLLLSKQVEKINKIKNNYDLCIVIGWAAARVAYFSGLNYIMYFVGNDISTPPFEKEPRVEFLKKQLFKTTWIERYLYKKIFNAAIEHVTGSTEFSNHLRKYDKNSIRIDKTIVDTDIFNENISPIKLDKKKFTFLAAQRVSLEKGYDVIWEALQHCKSDFEVLQIEWFDERTEEEIEIKKRLLRDTPHQVKYIPLIKRENLGAYFNAVDAILGQMRIGVQGGIERDAAFCKKPVLCYTDPKKTTIMNEKEIIPPFLPKTRNPQELAELIDNIVESKEFRDRLAIEEYNYIKELSNPDEVIKEWEKLFKNIALTCNSISTKQNYLIKKVKNFLFKIFEKYYFYKLKNKNIVAFGKEEYEKLTRK